jgi:hypothetical protein
MTRLIAVAAPVVALFLSLVGTPASGAVMGWWTKDPMNGAIEVPVNNSAGTGMAFVDYDDSTHLMRFQATWSGLTGTTTVSHIHANATNTPFNPAQTAGVATPTPTFPGFPAGVTAGSYDTTLDLTQASSWNSAFVTANGGTPATAEAAFLGMLNNGQAYWNIHTTFASGGEIRGFFHTPEPGTATLLAGAAVVAAIRRRRAR